MTLTLSNCQKKYAVESASIDSLILKNSKAMDYLKIDLITINERKNEMKGQIAVLQKIKPDSSVLEFVMNLDNTKEYLRYTNGLLKTTMIFLAACD